MTMHNNQSYPLNQQAKRLLINTQKAIPWIKQRLMKHC